MLVFAETVTYHYFIISVVQYRGLLITYIKGVLKSWYSQLFNSNRYMVVLLGLRICDLILIK